MVSEGDQAPAFELPGVRHGHRTTYELGELAKDGGALLAFYPSDFSPLCTRKLCTLRNVEWFEFREGLSVFGISQDTCYAHEEFAAEHDIPFPLLSDTDASVTDRYGVRADSWDGHPGLARRAFFLVDSDLTVEFCSITREDGGIPNLDPLLDAVHTFTTPDIV